MNSEELRQKTVRTKTKKRKVLHISRTTAASYKKKRESSLGLQNVFIIILPLLLPSFLPKLATV